MSLLELEKIISDLSSAEKAQVLQWVIRDFSGGFIGVESNSKILNGDPCIVRTRIPIWALVQMRNMGANESDILRNYPALRAEDLTNAWAYYRVHRQEIDKQILENENA